MSEEIKDQGKNVSTDANKKERKWAMLCHLSAFANFLVWIPAANVLGPLIIWAWKKKEIPIVDREGKEAMNFQISILIYCLIAAFLRFVLIGYLLFAVIFIFSIIFVIMASVTTYNGEKYTYPFTIRLIK